MNEMVERVARAIAEAEPGRNWDTMMEHGKEWWRRAARAAIAAMREPTEAMTTAGIDWLCFENYPDVDAAESFLESWELMIARALTN